MAGKTCHTDDTDASMDGDVVQSELHGKRTVIAGGEVTDSTKPSNAPVVLAFLVVVVLLGISGYMLQLHWSRSDPIPLHLLTAGDNPQRLTNKPLGDQRSYQASILGNGIQMINVQDERAGSSAFAVAVDAGSFDDPEDLAGLAHFCEHMLFLGTERYPKATEFDEFMSSNDGYNNAYTASEVTVYYAKLATSAAVEGLDRFADFFHAPLFDPTFLGREVHAIDSEHSKNVGTPSRRVLEVMYSLADQKSPVGRFHTGNMETLYEAPKRNNTDPTVLVKEYFDSHYCPARLHLVTFGPQTLNAQFTAANERFGQIPKGSETCYDHKRKSFAEPAAWPKTSVGKWVDIQGTQPKTQMWLVFNMKDMRKSYASQPLEYIRWVLKYAGRNSFTRVMRDTGLTTDFDVSADESSAGTMLVFKFELSLSGHQHYELVLDMFFAYLAKVRFEGVDLELYRSLADINQLEWDWHQPDSPSKTASDLAEALTRLPLKDLLSGDIVVSQPDSTIVEKMLKMLVPGNMNIGLVDANARTTSLKGASDVKVLPFYNVSHRVRDMKTAFPEAMARWESWVMNDVTEQNIEEQVRLRLRAAGISLSDGQSSPQVPTEILNIPDIPPSSDYMMTPSKNVSDRPGKDYDALLFGQRPHRLGREGDEVIRFAEDGVFAGDPEVWHRGGWVGVSPKVEVSVALRRPKTLHQQTSAQDMMRLNLYDKLLHEEMGPRLFDLVSAGVSYDIDINEHGIFLGFSGFQPNIPGLVDLALFELNREVDATTALYDRIYEETHNDLATYSNLAITYAVADHDLLLTHGTYSRVEMLEAMRSVTSESVASASKELVLSSPLQLTALTMGNFAESEAVHMVSLIAHGVQRPQGVELSAFDGEIERVTPVVNPSRPIEVRTLNPKKGDTNDAVVVSIISGVGNVENKVILGLLGKMLGELAYSELRTRMQLGYVRASALQISNVQLITCIVQGKRMNADEMEAAVEHVYSKLLPEKLESLSEDEFKTLKAAFRQELLQPPVSYAEEVKHFWSPVAQGGLCFGLRNEMIRFLDTFLKTKAALIDLWNRLMIPEHGVRKKVSVKYFAGESVPVSPSEEEAVALYQKQNVTTTSLALLRREHKQTLTLDRADAVSRAQLVQEGGYFPLDLNCESQPAPLTTSIKNTTVKIVHPEAMLEAKEVRRLHATDGEKGFLPQRA